MNSSQIRTLIIIVLIQAIAMISWAAVQEKPMKKDMGKILNNIINAEIDSSNNLEKDYFRMKNYQLFVYVGTNCQLCQVLNPDLQKFAIEKSELINIVLVYEFRSLDTVSLKESFAQTQTYEYLDKRINGNDFLYYDLFSKPNYLSYILTGPKHTIISDGQINEVADIQNLKQLITNN